MNWEIIFAGIAILVSIVTAISSFFSNRRNRKQQNQFEISILKLKPLESAKKDISKITSDLRRKLNVVKTEALQKSKSKSELIKDTNDTVTGAFREAVDVFKAVQLNLDENDAKNFNGRISEADRIAISRIESGENFTDDELLFVADTPLELETIIDKAIKDLQSEMMKN